MITQARLKECLDYDPLTGSFTWIKSTAYCIKPGMPADSLTCNGYIGIKLDGKNYLAHRLAWLYMFGEFPPGHLDHINCVRTDNRIANLRPATHTKTCITRICARPTKAVTRVSVGAIKLRNGTPSACLRERNITWVNLKILKMQLKPLSHLEMHDMANSLITAKPRVRSDHGHHRHSSRD
ncbi:HNH endonuclease signature motif containing protein [Enterobacter hormaechei]|uniref:HNH endonuclease signature motif containing protein n=1 Tax=Enterobacter hormaechei TaxID=158836 RepID=UPI003CE91DFA